MPYLWPDQNFDTLVMIFVAGTVAVNIIYEGLLLLVLSIMMKNLLSLKYIPNSRLYCKNCTLLMTKTAEKPDPLGLHMYLYSPYKGIPPVINCNDQYETWIGKHFSAFLLLCWLTPMLILQTLYLEMFSLWIFPPFFQVSLTVWCQ